MTDCRQPGSGGGQGGRLAGGLGPAATVAAARIGGDSGAVPGRAGVVQVGQARRADPQERGGAGGEEGAAAVGATAGADAPGGGDDGRAVGAGGIEAVPQG